MPFQFWSLDANCSKVWSIGLDFNTKPDENSSSAKTSQASKDCHSMGLAIDHLLALEWKEPEAPLQHLSVNWYYFLSNWSPTRKQDPDPAPLSSIPVLSGDAVLDPPCMIEALDPSLSLSLRLMINFVSLSGLTKTPLLWKGYECLKLGKAL